MAADLKDHKEVRESHEPNGRTFVLRTEDTGSLAEE